MILTVGRLQLPFQVYRFRQEGAPLYVFVCIREDKFSPSAYIQAPEDWSARGRLLAAWRGERNLGQRLLELAATGYSDYLAAEKAVAPTVREIVRD